MIFFFILPFNLLKKNFQQNFLSVHIREFIKILVKRILKRREALSCIPHSGFFSPRSYLTDDYHSRKSSARSRVVRDLKINQNFESTLFFNFC